MKKWNDLQFDAGQKQASTGILNSYAVHLAA
jgi:hypothetical protein